MRQSTRRGLTRMATSGFALGVGAAFLGLASPGLSAAENATPAYSASSSANLLRISALDAHPLGINAGPLVDLKVSTAGSRVDSTAIPRSEAAAAHLDLAVNQRLPDVPNVSVKQMAPPDNPHPTEVDAEPLNIAGLAEVGLGHVLAHARWNESCEKPEPTQITNASTSIANLALLPGANLGSIATPQSHGPVLELPNAGFAHSRTDIVDVEGQHNHGVSARARISLAQLILFRGTAQQITISVISPPTLTAVAAGSERSHVAYQAPVLEIATADGSTQRLDDPHAVVEIPLLGNTPTSSGTHEQAAPSPTVQPNQEPQQVPDAGGLIGGILGGLLGKGGSGGGGTDTALPAVEQKPALLRLSLGDLHKKVTPNKVSAEAASIRLQILDVPGSGTLLDLALGQLKAEATVPDGGLNPPNPTSNPSPNENEGAGKDNSNAAKREGNLPLTGTSVGVILGTGALLVVGGRVIMMLARRKATIDPTS